MTRTSSLSERPGRHRPRRLAEWLNPTAEKKVHSLVDKVYKRKNLELAWEKVKRNRGCGGIDGEDIAVFEARLEEQLGRLHCELRDKTYRPQPVMQHLIPKAGQPGKHRVLGIPTIYDRVCQQAILNRLEPIYCKAHARKLFHRLDRWVVRRLWSHRCKRWRNCGWRYLPHRQLYGEYGLVRLIELIPSLNLR